MNCVIACDCPGAPSSHVQGCMFFKEHGDYAGEQLNAGTIKLPIALHLCCLCEEMVFPSFLTKADEHVCVHCYHSKGPFSLKDDKEPADGSAMHEVPFAYEPDRTVVEKFTIEIQTPESPDYCGCQRCCKVRAEFWATLIRHKLQDYADNSDPLRVFPEKHKLTVQ